MKVKAKTKIFYNGKFYEKGEVFEYKGSFVNTPIMEVVEEKPKTKTKPKAKDKKAVVESEEVAE